jgi:hypothetical protein
MKIRQLLIITALLLLITKPAYAYLDGGTGSVIVQMLFAGLAGLIALMKLYWEKCKNFFRRLIALITGKPYKVSPPAMTPSTEDQHHDTKR